MIARRAVAESRRAALIAAILVGGCASTTEAPTDAWVGGDAGAFEAALFDAAGGPADADAGRDATLSGWTALPLDGAPTARMNHASAWTGAKMLVFGGGASTDGAAFDPTVGKWAPIGGPDTGGGPYLLADPLAAWTGSEMILLSGAYHVGKDPGSPILGRRSAYDPATGTWRFLANGPPMLSGSTAVWTGTEIVLWGGTDPGGYGPTSAGYRYDPKHDTWLPTSTVGAPEPRAGHVAIWTGVEMLVWGGAGRTGGFQSGGRYDPKADTWANLPTAGAPLAVDGGQVAVWTGTEMIAWGGGTSAGPNSNGARFSPTDGVWRTMTSAGAPSPRYSATAVWTGREMIIWGGQGPTGTPLRDGGRYDPSADLWRPLPVDGAPAGAYGHSAVWTGAEMIVWSGLDPAGRNSGTGARLTP